MTPKQVPVDLLVMLKKCGATLLAAVSCVLSAAAEPDLFSWLEDGYATGDWGGTRGILDERGLEIFGSYSAEGWGNVAGGREPGAVYTGLLDFGLTLDLEKLVGWRGATVSTTWLWLSGRDASADLVDNFLTISNIAGFSTLRMLELWFQQDFLCRGEGEPAMVSFRAGQLTADSEFVISDYSALFLNGTFGWPAFLYLNLPNGGPGYPMGTLGMRLAVSPWTWLTLQSAVFQGDVFAQDVNRHGFRWDLNNRNGCFWISEAQIRWSRGRLPGQAKFGTWFHTGTFADPFPDSGGNPSKSQSSDGMPLIRNWNYGFYGIVDQMIYRETRSSQDAGEDATQGLGWFGRIGFEPQDRNFLSFYFDTGLVYTGLVPGRDEDRFGVAFAYAQFSHGAKNVLEEEGANQVGAEMALEVSYEAVITSWLTIQPDAQLIINPGGSRDVNSAFVMGARVGITF